MIITERHLMMDIICG